MAKDLSKVMVKVGDEEQWRQIIEQSEKKLVGELGQLSFVA